MRTSAWNAQRIYAHLGCKGLSLKMPMHAPKIGFFWGILPPKWRAVLTRLSKGTSLGGNTSYDVWRIDHQNRSSFAARREPTNKVKNWKKLKNVYLRNHNTCFFHVFAQTTHVVAAPHGFACVGIPATRLYIPSFIKIRSVVSEPQGSKFGLSHYFG